MSKQDARKVTIIEELLARRISVTQASQLLSLSPRQVLRLKAKATANGAMAVLHKSRGRKPANAIDPALAQSIITTYQSDLAGYNFCHAADILAEEHGIFLSVSTVARYLKSSGIHSPKAKRRPKKHRSRDARACEGEMAQMDASRFDWLGTGSYLYLHGAVDDATGRVLALHFEPEETFEGYCELMFQMNGHSCLPREIYTDARSVFVYEKSKRHDLTLAEELAGVSRKSTQFARALHDNGMLLIIAGSPQAKGGIERLWGTLQDRLPKDMRRHGIVTVEQANNFLKTYLPYYNRKFVVQAASPEKLYLPKKDSAGFELDFSRHDIRLLDQGLCFSFQNKKYRLPAYHNNKKIPASPHDTLTVVTSRRLGMQVIFKSLILTPESLLCQPKLSAATPHALSLDLPVANSASNNPKPRSPWHNYNQFYVSRSTKSDISAEQLST